MRTLVLCHEGAPMAVEIFVGPIRKIILDHPDDDVDLWTVWSVPPAGSMQPSADTTADFARTWAMDLATGDTLDRHIAEAPAFVVHHARSKLVKLWLRRTAAIDLNFIPIVLRHVA